MLSPYYPSIAGCSRLKKGIETPIPQIAAFLLVHGPMLRFSTTCKTWDFFSSMIILTAISTGPSYVEIAWYAHSLNLLRDSWRPWASIVHSRTKWPAASIPIHWHSNASNYSYWHTSDGPCWFEQVTGRPHVNLTTSLSGLIRSTNRVFRSLRIAHLCIPLLDIMAREDPLAQSKNDIVIAYVEIFCDKYA